MRNGFCLFLALLCTALIWTSCGDKAPRDVSKDNLPKQVDWIHSWIGKGNISARTALKLHLANDRKAYAVEGQTTYSYSLDKKPLEGVLPADDVRQLLEVIRKVKWKRTQKPGEQVITENPEFINRSITFTLPGAESFRLVSTSNTEDGSPWNLYLGQKVYVTEDPSMGAQVLTTYDHLKEATGSDKK